MDEATRRKLEKEHVAEEIERTKGEMLGEDLIHILRKIYNQDAGTVKWVEHVVETEIIEGTKKEIPDWELNFYNELRQFLGTIFSIKIQPEIYKPLRKMFVFKIYER